MGSPWRQAAAPQAAYLLITGVWPFISMRSFLAVTGPKRELWLVRMVGLLACSTGGALALTARRNGPPPGEAVIAGTGSAAAFAAIDIGGVAAGRLRRVYLADAGVQAVLLLLWARAARLARRPPRGQ